MKRDKKKFHNITIDAFFKSSDVSDYEVYMKWLKPKNEINGKIANLEKLKLKEIMELRQLLEKPSIENILRMYKMVYKIKPKVLLECGVLELFQTNRFIIEYVKFINNREKNLSAFVTEKQKLKWKAAGGERLSNFREFGTMIQLGKMFSKSPRQIGEWNYNEVYLTLLYNSISDNVDKLMSELK